jgi:hypothetical protein
LARELGEQSRARVLERFSADRVVPRYEALYRRIVAGVTGLAPTDHNLGVMLQRARMALRECLEMNWFDTPAGGTV